MAFAHDDFYHSPATLKRISNQLLRDGVLRKKEKSLLDDFIYASTRFKIGGKRRECETGQIDTMNFIHIIKMEISNMMD